MDRLPTWWAECHQTIHAIHKEKAARGAAEVTSTDYKIISHTIVMEMEHQKCEQHLEKSKSASHYQWNKQSASGLA